MSQTKFWGIIIISLFTQLCKAAISAAAKVPTFWQEIPTTDLLEDSVLLQYYQRHVQKPAHKKIAVIALNINALQHPTMTVHLEGRYWNVNQVSYEPADQNSNDKKEGNEFQIWFGASESVPDSEKRPDFYFTVRGDKVAGKFFYNHTPYTLVPIYKNYHFLIEHQVAQLSDVCASDNDNSFFEEGVQRFKKSNVAPNNQDYTLRVLVALSQGALSRLRDYSATYSATHFAQNALQESNLAYLRGEIPFHLLMERVTYLSYSEAEMHRDLTNLSTEKPPFDQIKILRTQYLTDIQILVRNNEDPIAGLSTLRGRGLTDGKAFCVMSTDGMAFTPFALKHQIEHLVQNGVPSHEWSQRSSYLSSLRSHLKQSMIPLSPYHAFARHPDWYSTENGMESVVWDTLIRFSQNDPESGGILLPHWDLKWLDASSMTSCHSDCHSVGSDTLTKADIHQNTSRDPFGGIPIRIQPNPTSGKTRVEYAVADHQQGVTMRISTLTGQFIQFLVDDGEHPFGTYALQWDADWLPNGVYLCTLRAGGQTRTTRIVVSH